MAEIGPRQDLALITLRGIKKILEKIEKAIEEGGANSIDDIDRRVNKVDESVCALCDYITAYAALHGKA